MAKKKAAIGDLIKSDMSRRAIKKEPKTAKDAELFSGEAPVKKPNIQPEKKPPAEKAVQAAVPGGNAGFAAFIAAQTQAVGLTDEADLCNFYDFLCNQAKRYIRGFDAGRRFHG